MLQEDLKTCPDSKIRTCVTVDKSQLPTLSRATGQYRMLDTVLDSVPQQQNDHHAYRLTRANFLSLYGKTCIISGGFNSEQNLLLLRYRELHGNVHFVHLQCIQIRSADKVS